jgi:energy-coupling factor transporter transmembrane protein EcfT
MTPASAELVSSQIALSNKKSMGIGLLLTLFFGPIGMFYSTIVGAVILLIVGILASPLIVLLAGLPLLVLWPIQLVWTAVAVSNHNRRMDERALSAVAHTHDAAPARPTDDTAAA